MSENGSTSPRRWRSSGMCPSPASSACLRVRVREVVRRRPTMRPACTGRKPGDRVDQLALAVRVDAGEPEDLARRAPRSSTSRTVSSPRSSITVRSSTSSSGSPGCGGLLVDAQQHLAADHHPREALLGRARRRDRVDDDAAPQRRDAVGDLEHLVQLVRDEDDRLPLRLQRAEDLEQLLRLLRGEHGGRLVEDQDLRAAVERLQDLDALLLADGDPVDARVGVDGEPVALGELAHALRARRRSRAARRRGAARSRARCSPRPSSPG